MSGLAITFLAGTAFCAGWAFAVEGMARSRRLHILGLGVNLTLEYAKGAEPKPYHPEDHNENSYYGRTIDLCAGNAAGGIERTRDYVALGFVVLPNTSTQNKAAEIQNSEVAVLGSEGGAETKRTSRSEQFVPLIEFKPGRQFVHADSLATLETHAKSTAKGSILMDTGRIPPDMIGSDPRNDFTGEFGPDECQADTFTEIDSWLDRASMRAEGFVFGLLFCGIVFMIHQMVAA